MEDIKMFDIDEQNRNVTQHKCCGVSRRDLLQAIAVGSLLSTPLVLQWWYRHHSMTTITFRPPFKYGGYRSSDLGRSDINNIGGFCKIELFRIKKIGSRDNMGIIIQFLGNIIDEMGIDVALSAYSNDGKVVASKRHIFKDPRLKSNIQSIAGKQVVTQPLCWLGCDLHQAFTIKDLKIVEVTIVHVPIKF
jgi:hypothetical protein